MLDTPHAVDVRRLSELSGVAVSTLNKLRATPELSPPFVRIGHRVLYPLDAYRVWIAARTIGGTTGGRT